MLNGQLNEKPVSMDEISATVSLPQPPPFESHYVKYFEDTILDSFDTAPQHI